jgi:hypothetical protein
MRKTLMINNDCASIQVKSATDRIHKTKISSARKHININRRVVMNDSQTEGMSFCKNFRYYCLA